LAANVLKGLWFLFGRQISEVLVLEVGIGKPGI